MRLRSLLISLVLVLMFAATTTAQRAEWSGFKDLTLEITAPKASHVRLQPVPLILTLVNKTDRVLNGHSALKFSAHYLRLSVRREGADWREAGQTTGLYALTYVNPRAMGPGDKFTENEILSFRTEEIFPGPGTYEIKARFGCGDGSQMIESQPITIRITEPEDKDLEAYNFLRNNTKPEYFFTGVEAVRDPKARETLETFVAKFGDTAYGDDATYTLAQLLFVKNQLATARFHFETLVNKRDFIFAVRVKDYLAKIERKLALIDRR